MPNSSVILAIVNIIFYIPALPVAAFVVFRHGFKKSLGFFFIFTLSLIRLIGEPMVIATSGNLDFTNNISLAGFILSSVGVSPLTLAPLGLIHTANSVIGMHTTSGSGTNILQALSDLIPLGRRSFGGSSSNSHEGGPIPTKFLALVHFLPIIGVILSISGTTSASNNYSSPPSDSSSSSSSSPSANPLSSGSGTSSRAVSAGLYLGCWALLVLFALILLPYRSRLRLAGTSTAKDGLTQLYAAVLALPFLLARLIDQCLVSWGSAEDKARHLESIPLKVVLVTLAEWIIVTIVLSAGVRSRPAPEAGPAPLGAPLNGVGGAGLEMGKPVFAEPRVVGGSGEAGRYEELRHNYQYPQERGYVTPPEEEEEADGGRRSGRYQGRQDRQDRRHYHQHQHRRERSRSRR